MTDPIERLPLRPITLAQRRKYAERYEAIRVEEHAYAEYRKKEAQNV